MLHRLHLAWVNPSEQRTEARGKLQAVPARTGRSKCTRFKESTLFEEALAFQAELLKRRAV